MRYGSDWISCIKCNIFPHKYREFSQTVKGYFRRPGMKKRAVAILTAACMSAGVLTGCSGTGGGIVSADDSSDNSDYHFMVIVKSYQSTYWQAAIQGIVEAEEELEAEIDITGPNTESEIGEQVYMLDYAISQEPDGIILAANDQNAVLESLRDARDAGIPVVCFDTGVPEAPGGSVVATVATDNDAAGAMAAENMYKVIRDHVKEAEAQVRIGEVNQDSSSANITARGMGFIRKMKELLEADGKSVAVVGDQYYAGQIESSENEKTADVVIETVVPMQTTVELSAEAVGEIMRKEDTIAVFGSNQVTAEGILAADEELNVLASSPEDGIVGVGFDAGFTVKTAVADGTLIGAVVQAPGDQGSLAVQVLYAYCEGEEVQDIETDSFWYDAGNINDSHIAPKLYD